MELEQERHMADSLVGAMKPELRDRFMQVRSLFGLLRQEVVHLLVKKSCQHLDNWFMQLKSANVEYTRAMEEMNQELDVLASRKVVYLSSCKYIVGVGT